MNAMRFPAKRSWPPSRRVSHSVHTDPGKRRPENDEELEKTSGYPGAIHFGSQPSDDAAVPRGEGRGSTGWTSSQDTEEGVV